jgi:HEAT repeat protein
MAPERSRKSKRPALEDALAELGRLGTAGPLATEGIARLRAALADARSLVVARAARIVKERTLDAFASDLVAAFERFLTDAVKTDPGCNAKLAAIEALDYTDHADPDPFLAASRHVQLEPAWGRPVDTAAPLRARAVRALARLGHPDLALVAGELLADPDPPVRLAAAEALAHSGDRSAAGLLALMARRGDEDPVAHTAYLCGLLALAPDHGLPRLAAMLSGKDAALADLAAIALGQSGRDDAAGVLIEFMQSTPLAAERIVAVRALGLHRSDRALDVLLAIVADGPARDAEAAVRALSARRFEPRVSERVRDAVARSGRSGLEAVLAEAFPGDDR